MSKQTIRHLLQWAVVVTWFLCFSGASCKGLGLGSSSKGGSTPAPVALTTSQSTMAVEAVSGGGGVASPYLTITNPGDTAANWNAAGGTSWLTITPGAGTLTAHGATTIAVYVDASGLSSGTYTTSVTVSNTSEPGAPHTTVTITVIVTGAGSAPAVTTAPANQTVDVGMPATFAVTATGSVTLSYQWQKNSANIPGAINSYYTTAPALLADSGDQYRVIVTNGYGSVISSAATLTVNSVGVAPTVLTPPADQSVLAGSTASFLVTASGSAPLTYQWQKNSVNIAGATSSLYTTPATILADEGALFRVIVSNGFGSVTSPAAKLSVSAAGVAPTITSAPTDQTVAAGQVATFNVAADGTAPLTYQWYLPGHSGDVAIAGATGASYTTAATALSDNNSLFRVQVTNAYGVVWSDYVWLYVTPALSAPSIVTPPAAQTVSAGQTATFGVVAAGTAPLSYQWQKDTVDILGATGSSYTTPATSGADNGSSYRVVVTNPYGTATSAAATLTVNSLVPAIGLTPTTLNFTATAGLGDPATQTAALSNTGTGTLNWTATANQPWLTVSPGSGSTAVGPVTLTVGVSQTAPPTWQSWAAGAGLPSERETFSMVWTGSEVIIWGGWNGGGVLGDGARYNPVTGVWSPVATLNAPAARSSHVAVWTGSRMIVWGGIDGGNNYLNTGGRYNPATDTWSAAGTETTAAPSARRFAAAVWTGTEMIVWGGANDSGALQDGGRYNLLANTWSTTPISTGNAPGGRLQHSAVWTGNEMIVWGGTTTLAETDALNDGGRYNPATNTWAAAPITTVGAPSARFGHTTVWNGSRMIVWGGSSDLSTRLNTGAVYNPATNTWEGATDTTNAPAIRHHHGAVWTGSAMLVWGGWWGASSGGHVWLNDGGRYAPGLPLGPGSYAGAITLADPAAVNSPQTITVNFTVNSSAQPAIALAPTTLNFTTATGVNPAAQTVNLTNPTAGSILNWTAASDRPWLQVSPDSGTTTTGTSTLTVSVLATQTEAWTGSTTTTGAPSVREAMSVVWTGSEMIVWGGWADAVLPNGGIYNPATDSWRSISTVGAPAVAKHVAVWTGSKMIVWGGMNAGSGFLNTGAAYDPLTDTWTAISSTNAPTGRWHPAVCWTGTEMLVWSGQTSGGYVNNGGRYNPATDTWSLTPITTTNAPGTCVGASAVWTGSEMIVWGGTTDGGVSGLNDGGRYNPATNSWSLTPPTTTGAPNARFHHSTVWDGAHMLVWGGSSDLNTRLNDGGVYDPATDTWTGAVTTTGAPQIRHGHGAAWTGSAMLVWGGWWGSTGPSHLRFNDGAQYRPSINLAAGSYSGNLTVSDPSATNNPQTVTVSLTVNPAAPPMIVLDQTTLNFTAGLTGNDPAAQTVNLTNSGAASTLRWITASDQPWLQVTPLNGVTTTGASVLTVRPRVYAVEQWNGATATAGAPSAREDFSAAWTGTEMLVWGGYNGSALNTGGRYNPATNIWTAITATGAPAARRYHSAVWTGSRMLVWGGTNGSDVPVNDGAFYDPATNTWTGVTAVLNAPAARRSHSAVWTGSEMIVWNGLDKIDVGSGGLVLNDGKRYNPVTDTWSVAGLPTTDAPTGRYAHKAVWTGTEMIVWSGYNVIEGYMNTGGRFNPATNTWSATSVSTVGAPAARAYPALVWSGAEMLVWGGTLGGPGMQSGGRYNPTTNSWTSITTTGAPGGSRELEGVWTGTEFVVWGGNSGSGFLNTGARYQPPANLSTGGYTGHVTVSDPAATNNPQTITVNLTVTPPDLALSANTLSYDVTTDTIPSFTIDNTVVGGNMNWTLASDQPWLVPPASGNTVGGTPTTVEPLFTFITMAPGIYTANLTVTAPGATNSPQTVAVTLTVDAVEKFESTAVYLRDVYVTTTGNDSTGDGTVGNPYRTPAKALAAALPGDNIHVAAGTYAGHNNIFGAYQRGTAANPIKLSGDPNGGSVFDCSVSANGNALYGTGMQFLIVENFEIINFAAHGISFDGNFSGQPRGHHVIIRNCKVHNPQTTAVDCLKLNNTDCSVIENCDVSLNSVTATGSNGISTRFCFHTVIRRNYVHDCKLFGIRFGSSSHDNLAYANRLVNLPDRGINLTGFRNNAIGNLLVNVYNPVAFESADQPLAANNTIYRGRQFILWFSKNVAEPTETKNGRIVNNLFVFNSADLTNYCNNGVNTTPATFTYENNLWYSLDNPGFVGPTNTAAAETGALYQVDPQFVNVAEQDFHLQGGSGARGNGLTVAQALRDYDGATFATPRARGALEGLATPVPTFNLSTSTLTFNAAEDGPNPAAQTVNLTNTGAANSALNWTQTATQPWLQVSPFGGVTGVNTTTLSYQAIVEQSEAWTGPTSTLFAPSARENCSVVWTGCEMIVWGGFNGANLANGGRYNPVTDTWSAISTVNQPSARRHHTAAWTGNEMIVWGGFDSSNVNTGAAYNPALDTWTAITTISAPTARREHSAIWTGSEMIIWGGTSGSALNDGGRYNPTTGTWSGSAIDTTGAPSARFEHSAVWTGARMIIWGGLTDPSTTVNTGGLYDPVTNTWTGVTSASDAPSAREGHTAVFDGARMIVWGGESNGGTSNVDTGAIYTVATDTWTGATTLSGVPAARRAGRAIWTGREMIVWGGNTGSYQNTGVRYRPAIHLTTGTYNDTITLTDPAATNNPQTIAVTLTVASPPIPAIGLSGATFNFACNTGANPSAQGVTITNSGDPSSTLNWTAQAARVWDQATPHAGSITTGSNLLILQPIATQTEAWQTPISLTGAPTGRAGGATVWTGKELLVWGGESGYGIYETNGGLYNPATDSWSGTVFSTVNMPTARAGWASCWTGTELILWGGQVDAGSGPLNEGRIYTPKTNTWRTMSTVNSTGPLTIATAVWTGTEMIVWGGTNTGPGITRLNTGRKYNPTTNTWAPLGISTVNAPSARVGNTSVWTGKYMIIWGGDDASSYLNTGGLYDPVTDTWIGATDTTTAPSPRYAITSVWTGNEMIVYGGHPGGYGSSGPDGYTNTGARYDPVSNTWTATTTTGATGKTRSASSVWTGTQMIVFGGYDGFNFQQYGHRYKPTIFLDDGVYTDTITVADPAASNNTQSIAITLTVTGSPVAPTVTSDPATQTVYLGQQPAFFVGATGSPTLTYQWQKNTVDIPGATSQHYIAPAAVLGDNGATFRCVVSNGTGSDTSAVATLTVNTVGVGPLVTTHPGSTAVTVGQKAGFLVNATGSPTLTYQWQKNTVDIPAATSAYYQTPATVLGDSGSTYRCVITNGFGSATSLAATLTVNP